MCFAGGVAVGFREVSVSYAALQVNPAQPTSMKRPMSSGGSSTPFDKSQKFARWSRVISKNKIHFNKKISWAEETGDYEWHCESCNACFQLYPMSSEAQAEHRVKEIAVHNGKQESNIGQPHYCEDCGVMWKIDFSSPKEEHPVSFGSCGSADADGKGADASVQGMREEIAKFNLSLRACGRDEEIAKVNLIRA